MITFSIKKDTLTPKINASANRGRMAAAITKALYLEAFTIMHKSWPQVPVDKHILRPSQSVGAVSFSGPGSAEISFGYGGRAAAYALIQHENMAYNHTVGKDHYLSDPMYAEAVGFSKRAADVLTEVFGA